MAWDTYEADTVPEGLARNMAAVGVLPMAEPMIPGQKFKIRDQQFVVIAEASEDQFVAAFEKALGKAPSPAPENLFYYIVSTD